MLQRLLKKIKSAPTSPGCYIFKNRKGEVIYIGKAKNIRNRVGNYFNAKDLDAKTRKLVEQIVDVEFMVTDTEVEALLLEAELIRNHQPKYNIELKHGIRYAYIKFTNETFPRLVTTRTIAPGDRAFGPYTSGAARAEVIRLANRVFELRATKRRPRQVAGQWVVELGVVPRQREITPAAYAERLDKVALLLRGHTKELIAQLQAEMKRYAAAQNYEIAKQRRDQIEALVSISERQKVQLNKSYDQDVINLIIGRHTFTVQVFNINRGIISGRKEFKLAKPLASDTAGVLAEFLQQYYYEQDIPQEVIVPVAPADQAVLSKYLEKLAGRRVDITVPQRGDKKKLLELVVKNIAVSIGVGDASLLDLQNKLSLPNLPRAIECFDVSNLGATDVVGSMVYFADGKPDKNNYRRFKIKSFRGQSDFDAMREIIYRRYSRLLSENGALPDLVMVDGGKPQLSAARRVFAELGLQLPLVALAKREEEIYTPASKFPIRLEKTTPALKLLQRIRDEAHRFAITYQRLLRGKRT